MTLTCTIPGRPEQQGSKRNLGRHSIEANPNLAPWRADAIWRLQKAMQEQMVVQFTGPVEVVATFVYARPRSHYGTGKNAGKVKTGAPMWKASAADLDHLQRALGDALTQSGALRDDALIASWVAVKRWGPAGSTCVSVRGLDDGTRGYEE